MNAIDAMVEILPSKKSDSKNHQTSCPITSKWSMCSNERNKNNKNMIKCFIEKFGFRSNSLWVFCHQMKTIKLNNKQINNMGQFIKSIKKKKIVIAYLNTGESFVRQSSNRIIWKVQASKWQLCCRIHLWIRKRLTKFADNYFTFTNLPE